MNLPSTEQYINVIATQLSPRQIEILQIIYHRPNFSATAIELAEDMGYKSFRGANRQIGAIGQIIYERTGIAPPTYVDRGIERLGYFYLVGNYNGPGWKLWEELKEALVQLDLVNDNMTNAGYTNRLPTEVQPFEESKFYKEGKVTEVFVNRYERNRKARIECIKHYGTICQGCGFDFGLFYGLTAQGFVHVHHLIPLSEIGKSYKVDPAKDLVPLCANCHSVIHLKKPMLTVKELQKLIAKNNK